MRFLWGAFHGYAVPDVPDEAEVAWARFYDNYQFISDNRLGPEFGWDEDSSPGWVYSEYSPSSKGLLTGVYDGRNFEAYHYNTDGQMIQSYSAGFNKGRTNYVYTYSGQLQKTVHDPCDPKVPKVTEEYDYDVMGRQTGHRVLLHDSNTARTDTAKMSMAYNPLGQLSSRAFGACRQDFTYDIHGWLRSSETTTGELRNQLSGGTLVKVPKVISEKLEYAEGLFPRYNGNISSKVMDGEVYSYSYDGNNRLTSASMYRSNADRFSATYSYDAMSNLTSVKRRGIVDMVDMDGPKMESYGTLDDISISYDGNRISSVTAKSDAVAFEGMTGMGRNESDMAVSYDDAGRIVSDETRGITLIEYNNDGHPVRMVLDEGHEFHDAWDNLGNHLSTTIYMMQPSGTLNELPLMVREYWGNGQIITSAPALGGHRHVMTRFAGGYFRDGEVYYYVTDYQGNNVALVDGAGKIVEQTNYYPYGEPWREATEQPFLYAGNERLRLFGLNEYDFIARRYNPLLASFTTWDPLAEKYPWLSPYAYCAGNPIIFTDPNGEDPTGYEAALMAAAVYKDEYYKDRIKELNNNGWHISSYQTSIQKNHPAETGIGVQSMLFEKTVDGVTEYAYVYAGTNSIEDVVEDVLQIIGLSGEYSKAVENAQILSAELKDNVLTFVGHSMGGGNATVASMVTGRNAITFNTAVVSPLTMLINNVSKHGEVVNYVSTSNPVLGVRYCVDPVSVIQNKIGMRPIGSIVPVATGYLPTHSINDIVNSFAP